MGMDMQSQEMSPNVPLCGICGRPMEDGHSADRHGAEDGRRVEYVVVGRRGGLVEVRQADVEARIRKTDASMLALNLGVDESTLVGRRYSCWVVPDEYGFTRSDFRLVSD